MVNSISGAPQAVNTSSSGSFSNASNTTGGDFETFLRMLTTQLQNQDPLNPMESTDFAVQLATFSGVEQQVRTNSLLGEILSGSSGGGLGQLSGWIGRDVRTIAPVWFDGDPLTLQIAPKDGADEVNLIVLDGQGRELSRESIGTGPGEADWQGLDDEGAARPDGFYQFHLESMKDGAVIGTSAVASYSRVIGVELSNTGPMLVLEGGNALSVDEVTALRE